jgi:hypothetical protein
LASSEPNSPTIANPRCTITPEKQNTDLKSLLMMMMEDYKKEINNSLKEIQENTSKQVKELNKTIQDLKMEVETIKKSNTNNYMEAHNHLSRDPMPSSGVSEDSYSVHTYNK